MRQLVGVMSFVTFMAVSPALQGQDAPPDPPSRIARLNYMDGSVSFRPGNLEEWAGATLNYPLTDGDRLWTDKESRAELHIGATAIHMAEQTAFGILKLDDHLAQMSLAQGTVYLRIPRLEEDEVYEMDTPSGSITVRRTGDYRFDVSEDGEFTLVTVRSGEAEVTGAVTKFTVRPGRALRLSLTAANEVIAEEMQAEPLDPWEEWCVSRDGLSEHSAVISDNYVTPEMTGVEDLAQYGDWTVDAEYGPAWCPRGMAADWAPYRYGRWAYVGPWGWTWIDDAAWGFAPFHFGRWVRTPNGWEWIPGPRGGRPVYAPALVTFVGTRTVPQSAGARVIAWVPLGPREPFRPPYRASDQYTRRLNGPLAGSPGQRAGERVVCDGGVADGFCGCSAGGWCAGECGCGVRGGAGERERCTPGARELPGEAGAGGGEDGDAALDGRQSAGSGAGFADARGQPADCAGSGSAAPTGRATARRSAASGGPSGGTTARRRTTCGGAASGGASLRTAAPGGAGSAGGTTPPGGPAAARGSSARRARPTTAG